jgi:hypothetical protein
MVRVFAVLTMVALVSSCSNTVTRLTPTPTMHTTFFVTAGTVDPDFNPCTPATPPAPTIPAPPAAQRLLVGYQDWRNTTSDTGGDVCTSSIAKRWKGVATFDMSQVASDINATPYKTLSGTLTYHINSNKVPQSNAIDMCVASLQMAAAVPTADGFVTLPVGNGQNNPPSSPPTLGALNLPGFAPIGQITTSGPATVNPAGPDPTVSVDVTLLLSDWGSTKPPQLAIAFVPQGPTMAQLGLLTLPDPLPVPTNRSTAACISNVKDIALVVNVGR